jgi:hypothetical protein
MTRDKSQKFSEKHGPNATLNNLIKDKILANAKNDELACAVAFKIAGETNTLPAEVGRTVDLLDFRLVKCQLGLFGYKPEKKIVTAKSPEDPNLEDAIHAALTDETLSCRDAWEISRKFQIPKMAVSAACEALKIKVKPCQLGAF